MSWRSISFVTLAAIAVFAAWAAFPRRPSLATFDPDALARADTQMWRAYYDRRYLALFAGLYSLARDQYGFSPLDAARIAVLAASAAKTFQPTRSRAEAEAALPALIAYYGIAAKAVPAPFDVEAAARAELDWWQARREGASAESYGLTIARTSALVFGRDNAPLREAGILRARAMDYRDTHGAAMTEADWTAIYEQLQTAYRMLKRGIDQP
jgi:hypothetical protein